MSDPVVEALRVWGDPAASPVDKVRAAYALPVEAREAVREEIAELDAQLEAFPWVVFAPHSDSQRAFFEASTRIQAAFAGNRFGKTTSLVIKSLLQCCRRESVPEILRPFKVKDAERFGRPVAGRLVSPSFSATVEGVILPAFRKWCPASELRGGTFDKAWDKQLRILRFADGSWLQVMTYEQDVSLFGGAALDFVGYDEPPPKLIREECRMRLVDYGGFEMFALTPLEGAGWMRKAIWSRRNDPDVTVVTGSIHDNPTLNQAAKQAALEDTPEDDVRRRSREFGEFVEFGDNLIYPDFHKAAVDPPTPNHLRDMDVVVGIDPGMRNAAFVWVAFDNDNTALVFDEALLQSKTAGEYAATIRRVNERWGVKPRYVIDPSARNRSLVNAQSVESLLNLEGIYPEHGQNAVEAGIQQVRGRLRDESLIVSRACVGLFDEADDYRTVRREDGEFHVVKENDHRLDCLRYVCMTRLWHRLPSESKPKHRDPTQSWPPSFRGPQKPVAPTGSLT